MALPALDWSAAAAEFAARERSERLVPIAQAATISGRSRPWIYDQFRQDPPRLTKHEIEGRTFVDLDELETLMLDAKGKTPGQAARLELPSPATHGAAFASLRLRESERDHDERHEQFHADVLGELRAIRSLLSVVLREGRL